MNSRDGAADDLRQKESSSTVALSPPCSLSSSLAGAGSHSGGDLVTLNTNVAARCVRPSAPNEHARPVPTTVPVTTVPVATVPVAPASVATVPVTTVPVAAVPVTTVPVATAPVATVPVATAPVSMPLQSAVLSSTSAEPQAVYGEQPSFRPAHKPNFSWSPSVSGADFVDMIRATYEEVLCWRRNIFLVPSGKAGKAFVQETARLLQSFADGTALEGVAFKAVTVLHALLLQNLAPASTAQDHLRTLERRLPLWQSGDVDGLLRECRSIQVRLPQRTGRTAAEAAQRDASVFAKLMMVGNIKAAIRYV